MSEKRPLIPRYAEAHHPAARRYVIRRAETCINCGTCISACPYGCHERDSADIREMADPKENCCRNCFSCVFRCPRNSLSMVLHPDHSEEKSVGVFTPEKVLAIQDQAAEGKVPVSGSGYGGAFSGEGYDNMWTDMSEIVRPTRDGIHGREHISTSITLGRKIEDLCGLEFDSDHNLKSHIPPNREIPIPMLFGLPPFPVPQSAIVSMALAASKLETMCTVTAEHVASTLDDGPEPRLRDFFNHLIIRMRPADIEAYHPILTWASMIELDFDEGQLAAAKRARGINSQLIAIIRQPVREGVEHEVVSSVVQGAEIVHLSGDPFGKYEPGISLIDCLRRTHLALVDAGLRDQVTLLASGGISMAEHLPKTILLGADGIFVDSPLLVAMECSLCGDCTRNLPCPKSVGVVDATWSQENGEHPEFHKWGASRVINLMLSWRDQLLEVLGAMGIRDVRRIRGETGRAIFADKMHKDFLGRLQASSDSSTSNERSTASCQEPNLSRAESPWRFPQEISDWTVLIDRELCVDCGLCVASCQYDAHHRPEGKAFLAEPRHSRCIGDICEKENEWCCVKICPWEAIRLEKSSVEEVLGDARWTSKLLSETYRQAISGEPLENGGKEQLGASGGGFDALRLRPLHEESTVHPEEVSLGIDLNKRHDFSPKLEIPLPWYGGGMSYGSISLPVMLGRAMAAKQLGTFTSTGEGGYPDDLLPFKDHVITQIATGLFGVREETILRARLVEFKYAQGAKPGLGGHLLGEKNTPAVAHMREAVEGTGLFSPFPFHSVYSVEDHKKHLDWIRSIHPDVLLSVKVSTPADVDMVAVGSFYAGANIVNLDGAYGGTGAAPDIAKKNIAMPIEYAVAQVHDFLSAEGIRDQVTLIAGGGVRSPDDIVKAIALGADGVVIGTAELVAIDCVRCGNCERGRGCPIGIASTDVHLATQLESAWVCDRIVGLYSAWAKHLRRRLAAFGLRSVRELCGRRDLLRYMQENSEDEA